MDFALTTAMLEEKDIVDTLMDEEEGFEYVSEVDAEEESKYIRSAVVEEGQILTGKVFRKIGELFKANKAVYIKDYGEIKDSVGEIVYVGKRFATVQLKNGYKVSINYGSILDNQNQKGEVITRVEFF